MKKLALVALAAAVALAWAPVRAEEQAQKAGEMKAEAKTEKISGTIAKVDATAKTIEVKEGERVVNLKLEEKTEIHRGKDRLKLADLKVGDRVEVEARGDVARHITLKREEPAPAKTY